MKVVVSLAALILAGVLFAVFVAPHFDGSGRAADADEPSAAPGASDAERPSTRRSIEDRRDASSAAVVDGTAAWVGANNAGVAAIESDRLDAAVASFEEALDLLDEDTSAQDADLELVHGNLAEALVRRAREAWDAMRFDAALDDLTRAVVLAPQRADLALLLERWKRERAIEAEFARYSSQRFDLSYDGDNLEILAGGAQRAVELLERAYGELWLFLGHDPVVVGGERIDVVFYSPDEFRDVTGLGHWAGGAYDGRIRVPIADFDGDASRWSATLWHELTHAFLHDLVAGGPPGWLDEGLAQWMEPSRASDVQRARRSLRDAPLVPLPQLEGTLSALGDAATIRRGYATSLVFVDHLVSGYGEYVVREMLAALAAGESAALRFEAIVGFPLAAAWGDLADELARE